MIEVENLSRFYGKHSALEGVSFSIQEREVVGFLGLNGAGKSTTLKILAGLLMPSDGRVRFQGQDLLESPEEHRSRIGFLPEEPPLYREMRVEEYLLFCGQLKGLSPAEVRARLPEVYQLCDLSEVSQRVIETLSHGYKKRVGIAQAILHRPELVILDEPISGLDPVQIVEMRRVITQLKADCTVLLSSHILSEISQTCDRLLVLNGGRLVGEGSQQELSSRVETGGRMELLVRGDRSQLESLLKQRDGVEVCGVSVLQDGTLCVEVEMKQDQREELVRALVEAGLGLRGLRALNAELERVFLGLAASEVSS